MNTKVTRGGRRRAPRGRSALRGRTAAWCAALLLIAATPAALAVGPYQLPICQTIEDDFNADPVVRQAQLAHCDKVEEVLVEFVNRAPGNGYDDAEVRMFAVLFLAPAHWAMLAEIELLKDCGNGTCEASESNVLCPEDCSNATGNGGNGGTDDPDGVGNPDEDDSDDPKGPGGRSGLTGPGGGS